MEKKTPDQEIKSADTARAIFLHVYNKLKIKQTF